MAFAVRQSASAAAFGGSTTPSGPAITFPSGTLSGSLLVATININDDILTTQPSASDPVNGAWTLLAGSSWHGANGSSLAILYISNAAALTNAQAVTIKWGDSGGNAGAGAILEITGIATSTPLDPATYTTATGTAASAGTTSCSPSLTTTIDNDAYLLMIGSGAAVTYTTPTGWTLDKAPSGGGISQSTFHITSTSQAHGTVSATATDSASPVDAWMVAFQPSGGTVINATVASTATWGTAFAATPAVGSGVSTSSAFAWGSESTGLEGVITGSVVNTTVASAPTWGAVAAPAPSLSIGAGITATPTWASESAQAPALQTSNILGAALTWGTESTGLEGVFTGTVINATVAAVPTWGSVSAPAPSLSLGVSVGSINQGGAERAFGPALIIVSVLPAALAWESGAAGPGSGVLIGGAVVSGYHTVSDAAAFVHTMSDLAVVH